MEQVLDKPKLGNPLDFISQPYKHEEIKIEITEDNFIKKIDNIYYKYQEVSSLFYKTCLAYNNMIETGNENDPINILLYGPGGYGKSVGTLMILKELGLKAAIIECSSSTTISDLFSGINVKVLTDAGIKLYNFELSPLFNNQYDVIIFEEGLTMPQKTLTDLRTLLTQKHYNLNDKKYYLTCRFTVMLTNVDPKIMIDSSSIQDRESLKAIVNERFPKHYKVMWDTHTADDYLNVLKRKFKLINESQSLTIKAKMYCKIMEMISSKAGKPISPRTAGISFNFYMSSGIKGLLYQADIDNEILLDLIRKDEIKEVIVENEYILEQYEKITNSYLRDNNIDEKTKINIIDLVIEKLNKYKFDPSTNDKRNGYINNKLQNEKNELINKYLKKQLLNNEIPENIKKSFLAI